MAHGLQIFRSDGSLALGITDRLTRHLATAYVSIPAGNTVFVPLPATYTGEYVAFTPVYNIYTYMSLFFKYSSTGVYVTNTNFIDFSSVEIVLSGV